MSNPQHEPTMEEILASIRKIISEDSAEPAAPAPEPPKLEAVAPAPADDILDLTEEVHEEPAHAAPAPVAEAAPHDDIVFETAKEEPPMAAPQPVAVAPAPMPAPEPVFHREEAPATGLFRDRSRSALDDALSQIHEASAPAAPATSGPLPAADGTTLAGAFDKAIREAFDPVLRDWLSEHSAEFIERVKPVISDLIERHLPDMLAAAVREEMANARARQSRR